MQRARRRMPFERTGAAHAARTGGGTRDQLEKYPAGRRAAEPARAARDQGRRAVPARPGRRDHLCVAGRRKHHGRHGPARRDVELPDARRAAGAARPERVLARAPIAPGEHQQDQGDRPLVQPELHPEDEGREGDGNPGQPHADAAAAGVPEAVGRPIRTRPDPARPASRFRDVAADAADRSAIRGRPRSRRGIARWRRCKEELVAWVKTLVSAAVYAIADRHVRLPGGARRGPEHGADARRSGSADRQQARVPHRRAAARRHRDALLPAQPRQVVRQARDRRRRRHGAHRRRPRVRERRPAEGRLRPARVPQPRRLGAAR